MTSKPTARERFEEIKAGGYDGVHGGPLTKDFLISLVEAAVGEIKEWHDNLAKRNGLPTGTIKDVWKEINRRMGEGEK